MAFLITKELRNGVLLKIYTNGKVVTDEEKQTTNHFAGGILKGEGLEGVKVVLDFEDGEINIFENVSGKFPLQKFGMNQLDLAKYYVSNLGVALRAVSTLNQGEAEVAFSLLRNRLGQRK